MEAAYTDDVFQKMVLMIKKENDATLRNIYNKASLCEIFDGSHSDPHTHVIHDWRPLNHFSFFEGGI